MLGLLFLAWWGTVQFHGVDSCFAPTPFGSHSRLVHGRRWVATDADWIDLSTDGAVKKKIVVPGTTDVQGSQTFIISYTGTLIDRHWSPRDVTDAWLSSQQGLEDLAEKFLEYEIDGDRLIDPAFFTEDFVKESLGVGNKIKAKKLVMASRRLAKTMEDFPSGTIFDSNESYVISKRQIQGMEIGLKSMKLGEEAQIQCRCDYGYEGEGYRKANGDVIVPPYASLCFDIKVLAAS